MSTNAEIEAVSRILHSLDAPVIYDLGAYCGEDSEMMREACGQSHTLNVIVEPDPRNMQVIRDSRRGVRTLLVEAAIADRTGFLNWYPAIDKRNEGMRSGSGSIRKPTQHKRLFPDIQFGAPAPMPCWSFDHLALSCTGPLVPIDLIWADLQGAERDMIAGARFALGHARYLFIEAEETQLYEGQATRAELLAMLPQFRVIGEFDYNLLLEHV
jgi:FkbM family methyltransferase